LAGLSSQSLASFIATQSKVSTLAAKLQAKRTRTALVSYTVSPKPFSNDKIAKENPKSPTRNCDRFSVKYNPLTRLYLEEWLANYFKSINSDYLEKKPLPNQLKIQSMELSSFYLSCR
jgi:hypothetical protein